VSAVSTARTAPRGGYRRTGRRARIAAYCTVVALSIAVLFPFLWMFHLSFKQNQDLFAFPPKLFFEPTLNHYATLFDKVFTRSFVNSLVTSVASTLVAMLVGTPAAFALSRASYRRDRQISLWVLATRMAPPIAFTLPYFLIFRVLGLLDTRTGLISIYVTFNLSLVLWMMRSFFDATPRSLEEAAWIDGCGVWEAFWRITLPLSAPGLAATAIFCFLFSWNDFFFALILTRAEAQTAPVAVVNFMNYEHWEWGKIAAGGTCVMLPVLIFAFVVRRYLVAGLSAGAVKG
jgi:multiple sugar transport system permease protein